MAVEWYYIQSDTEHGPVGGKTLKGMADAGNIFPWTPVRRVAGNEQTPWTRAGAIKALFPGDVIDQLGPPICDDCGTQLVDGNCPRCTSPEPPPFVPPAMDEPPADQPPSSSPDEIHVEQRYPNLRAYVDFLRVAARIIYILGIILALFFVLFGILSLLPMLAREEWSLISLITLVSQLFFAVLAYGAGHLLYVLTMALAETFVVIMDNEENTRRTDLNTRPR